MLTAAQIDRVFTKFKVAQLARRVTADPRPAVSIRTIRTADSRIAVGTSKFNGRPDLSPRAKWPAWKRKPLQFLAQIDCAAARRTDRSGLLPDSGLLSFFYVADQSTWGFSPGDSGSAIVLHTPAGQPLERRPLPVKCKSDMGNNVCALFFKAVTTFPDLDCLSLSPREQERHWDGLWQAFAKTVKKGQGEDNSSHHRLLGHPTIIQGAMEEECQFVSNGIEQGGDELSAADRRKMARLRPGAKDWTLLLQLDSDDVPGWMWGDVGVLYFWIPRQDLVARDFSRVWCILQCG